MYLTENLKALRKSKNLTQETVAAILNVAPQTVSKWERGETYPDITLLPALAHLYRVSVDALLGMDKLEESLRQGEVYTNARRQLKNRDWNAAIRVYEQALSLWPADQGILCDLAMALALKGDETSLERAIRLLEEIVKPEEHVKLRHTARAALCYAYQKAGRTQAAEKAVKLLPHTRESREQVGPNLANTDEALYELSTGEKMQ